MWCGVFGTLGIIERGKIEIFKGEAVGICGLRIWKSRRDLDTSTY